MSKYNRSKSGRFLSLKEKNKRENSSLRTKKEDSDASEVNHCVGRRIVNVNHLGQEMWCLACNTPLSFRDIENETKLGLLSIFYIRCRTCLAVKTVATDTKTVMDDHHFCDVNLKAAIAMIDIGIGPTQLNGLLSALNIPPPSKNLFKRYERKVGPILERVAEKSCQEAVELEKSLTQQSPLPNSVASADTKVTEEDISIVKIAASYDMGWQKRGNGKSYDSLTGHGSFIGLHSKRVLNFGIRSKTCRKCNAGDPKSNHDCQANFGGSAKAMEADAAVQLVNSEQFKKSGVEVGVLIGDDDSATISAIKRCGINNIFKWSDINHAKKGLGNMLYRLQKSHREMTSCVIKYFKKCFGYALQQNKNNEEGTKKAILSIVDHAFDNHINCGDWCNYQTDPANYRHRGLPGGKGLKGESYGPLKKFFEKTAFTLAPCASSQPNESFNMTMASKAPKAKFYGGSESLNYRLASAVSQKNLGTSYIIALNRKLGLSPGRHSERQRKRADLKRMQTSIKNASTCFKRRRLFLKQQRGQTEYAREAREGITYPKI